MHNEKSETLIESAHYRIVSIHFNKKFRYFFVVGAQIIFWMKGGQKFKFCH